MEEKTDSISISISQDSDALNQKKVAANQQLNQQSIANLMTHQFKLTNRLNDDHKTIAVLKEENAKMKARLSKICDVCGIMKVDGLEYVCCGETVDWVEDEMFKALLRKRKIENYELFRFKCKWRYRGSVLHGLPRIGNAYFENGSMYEGEWKEGWFCKGRFSTDQHAVYEGEWKEGVFWKGNAKLTYDAREIFKHDFELEPSSVDGPAWLKWKVCGGVWTNHRGDFFEGHMTEQMELHLLKSDLKRKKLDELLDSLLL